MKITTEIEQVNFNCLNKSLKAFSKVLNDNLVASGNKIELEEKDDGYDSYNSKQKHHWVVKVSIEWEKKTCT
jgi:hypothetical protein